MVAGAAAHIDRQANDSSAYAELVDSLEKDYLDWYLLTQARTPAGFGSRVQGPD